MNVKKVLGWLIENSEKDAQRYYGSPYYPFDKDYNVVDLGVFL